ncbi:hypothetical protein, partial [Prevotellamassilia timonensis]|uniref:hypothetical protein n=1 Tax=Prevotellamassilia timonensis TaxID=1852370 RepID=UPI00307AA5C5
FFIHFQTKIREKRDHFQTITPGFSSISKPKFGKNVTISKPKHPVFHPFPNHKLGKVQPLPNQSTLTIVSDLDEHGLNHRARRMQSSLLELLNRSR